MKSLKKLNKLKILIIMMLLVIVANNVCNAVSYSYENGSYENKGNTNVYNEYNSHLRNINIDISDISDISDTGRDDLDHSRCSVNRMIGAVLTLTQILGVFIALIMGMLTIIKYIYISLQRNKLRKLYRKPDESKEEINEIKKEIKRVEKTMGLAFFIGMFVFFASGILGITKNFAKPIIYLYPEKEKKVKVKVSDKNKLICTYPKYKDGWEVIAKPNGDLTDCETGRKLYALYWEGKNTLKHDVTEGFIVKGEDSIKFLEEKLEILGLNEREAEEFIVYWLPKLESNKYNFIRFETLENLNKDMSLEIEPKPDTLIRVMMVFKGINKPYDVKEQKIETPERRGFTVVEWGGTEL